MTTASAMFLLKLMGSRQSHMAVCVCRRGRERERKEREREERERKGEEKGGRGMEKGMEKKRQDKDRGEEGLR